MLRGSTILANSLPSALLLPFVLSVIQRGATEREELNLGEEYLRYRARVRRWV